MATNIFKNVDSVEVTFNAHGSGFIKVVVTNGSTFTFKLTSEDQKECEECGGFYVGDTCVECEEFVETVKNMEAAFPRTPESTEVTFVQKKGATSFSEAMKRGMFDATQRFTNNQAFYEEQMKSAQEAMTKMQDASMEFRGVWDATGDDVSSTYIFTPLQAEALKMWGFRDCTGVSYVEDERSGLIIFEFHAVKIDAFNHLTKFIEDGRYPEAQVFASASKAYAVKRRDHSRQQEQFMQTKHSNMQSTRATAEESQAFGHMGHKVATGDLYFIDEPNRCIVLGNQTRISLKEFHMSRVRVREMKTRGGTHEKSTQQETEKSKEDTEESAEEEGDYERRVFEFFYDGSNFRDYTEVSFESLFKFGP